MITFDPGSPAPLPLTILPDGVTFRLEEHVAFQIGTQGAPIMIVVPKGFETDLASVPGWAMIFGFDKTGPHSWAAIVHDWLFVAQPVGFETCNAIFYDMLRKSGVGRFRACVMVFAVQAKGKRLYKTAPARWRETQPLLAARVLGET